MAPVCYQEKIQKAGADLFYALGGPLLPQYSDTAHYTMIRLALIHLTIGIAVAHTIIESNENSYDPQLISLEQIFRRTEPARTSSTWSSPPIKSPTCSKPTTASKAPCATISIPESRSARPTGLPTPLPPNSQLACYTSDEKAPQPGEGLSFAALSFCRDNLYTYLANNSFSQCFWDNQANTTYIFSMARNYTFSSCGNSTLLTVPAIPGGNTEDKEMQDLLINQCRHFYLRAWAECPHRDSTGRVRPGIGGNWTVGCVDYGLRLRGVNA
ncbi:hypothetical protein Purlil1_12466 [Purpureocillium lilacinum]|uniref:Uncharacterized protein n=1 Tax=Purpureocillium lilacinum TaxID=33203 RepID=A0ABR0BGT9_PURLI|nr:hypothetical protein Purlil1_12466 [Purpureocillium lilacinum]